jgi:hypothetical protein
MPAAIRLVLSIAGVLILLVGVALMVKGALPAVVEPERGEVPKTPIEQLTDFIRAITDLLKVLDKYLGPNQQVRVGALLVIIGLLMAFGPWMLPTSPATASMGLGSNQ